MEDLLLLLLSPFILNIFCADCGPDSDKSKAPKVLKSNIYRFCSRKTGVQKQPWDAKGVTGPLVSLVPQVVDVLWTIEVCGLVSLDVVKI